MHSLYKESEATRPRQCVSLAESLGRPKSCMDTVVRLQIVLLIGAAEYPLTTVDAVRLEHTIRRRCVDERHLPFDDDARACLQLADVLAEDLAAGASPEPIDLGMSHVEGLCERVLDDEDVAAAAELTHLCDALRRSSGG